MTLYKSLLFLHGHVADVALARSMAGVETDTGPTSVFPARVRNPSREIRRAGSGFFGSFWYLGGLEDLDPRIHELGDACRQAGAGRTPGTPRAVPRQPGCVACA